MPVDPALVEMMLDTVSVKHRSTLNSYAEASFGTAFSVTCRVEPTIRMVRNAEGQEVVSSTTIYTDQIYGLLVTDQITLPDGSIPEVISVSAHTDEIGPSHEVVALA